MATLNSNAETFASLSSWRKSILQQLHERQLREQKPFECVINFCSNLFDKVDSVRSENVLLSIQKEKLLLENDDLKVKCNNEGPNGKVSERQALIDKKMFEMQEELTALHRKKGENAQMIIELKTELESKQKQCIALTAKHNDTQTQLTAANDDCKLREQKIYELESQLQLVKDEHQALQIAFNALEKKNLNLERDHCELVTRWMAFKAKDADKLNDENDKALKAQQEKMRKQLEEATRDMTVNEIPSTSTVAITCDPLFVCSRIPNKVMFEFEAHEGEVNAIMWSTCGDIVATGGGDRKVKMWQITHNSTVALLKATLSGSNAAVTSIDLDKDYLLASSNDYASRVWALSDMKLRRTLTGHSNKVLSVKFLGSSNRVASGSHDRTIKIWDLNRHACIRTLFAGSSCNDLVAVEAKDSVVASAHFDKRIRFWDTRSDSSANEILLQGKVTSLDVSPDGFSLLCCVRDDTLKCLDLRMNQVLTTFCAEGFKVGSDWTRCKFSPDNQFVGVGSSDGALFIWSNTSGKLEKVLSDSHNCNVIACTWSPNGNLFISTDRNKKAIVWSEF